MKINKFSIKLPRLTVHLAATLAICVTTFMSGASAFAWGPERQTFVGESPADYVTFNSMTNNAKVGDERNFVRIREAGTTGNYVNEMKLAPGKEYEVMTFYHNNAKDSLNASGKGVAKDTTLKIQMPSVVKVGERGKVSSTITASNAKPGSVWDEAFVTTDTDLALRYIPNSARVNSNGAVKDKILPDSVFTTGALLGYDELNGVLPGCAQYSGYVIFKIKTEAPNFTIKKQVSKKGENKWQDRIVAKLGEEVDFLITYQNTGDTKQTDVIIKDALPTGMKHVAGSVSLANSANPQGAASSDAIFTNGSNIGAYDPKGNAFIKLTAKVDDKLEKCGKNELTNHATAITKNGNKQAKAVVEVEVQCQPNECKPGIPAGDARCSDGCVPKEGEIVDANGNCAPVATSLPKTGPAEVILSFIGLMALVAAVVYWYRSRMDVKRVLAGAGSVEDDIDHTKTEAANKSKISHESRAQSKPKTKAEK